MNMLQIAARTRTKNQRAFWSQAKTVSDLWSVFQIDVQATR